MAAERQPGPGPARLGQRRALLGGRLRVDDRAALRARASTSRATTSTGPTAGNDSRTKSLIVSARRRLQVQGVVRRPASTSGASARPDARAAKSIDFKSPRLVRAGRPDAGPAAQWEAAARYGQREAKLDNSDRLNDDVDGDAPRAQLLLPPPQPEVPGRRRADRDAQNLGPSGQRSGLRKDRELRLQAQFIF